MAGNRKDEAACEADATLVAGDEAHDIEDEPGDAPRKRPTRTTRATLVAGDETHATEAEGKDSDPGGRG